ncbi:MULTISPECIES: hypothetical protein [unclassified Moorena]|uniref:hypothetical protein n=1 Tax=unclassified Moorena TaxID=2683338 RepID=UPI0013FE71B2|nr:MULTISPECIES: hypothetical protein [unclassified Moorena]NEO13689.1 hypothetical protein [Moorena sp. SIO3E8]NEQ03326.1 hypothetical protein [Moorena sp. SIO3F7]
MAFWPFGHATRTATLREWSRGARSHGAAAAKSGNDHSLPITRCSAVAQPENTGRGVV